MNRLTKILLSIFVITALAFVGDADYQDEIAQADRYTHNVCHGFHPDYDNRSPSCE